MKQSVLCITGLPWIQQSKVLTPNSSYQDFPQVEGYIDVPGDVSKIESAVATYGSVMTCMRWGETPADDCYMANYREGYLALSILSLQF